MHDKHTVLRSNQYNLEFKKAIKSENRGKNSRTKSNLTGYYWQFNKNSRFSRFSKMRMNPATYLLQFQYGFLVVAEVGRVEGGTQQPDWTLGWHQLLALEHNNVQWAPLHLRHTVRLHLSLIKSTSSLKYLSTPNNFLKFKSIQMIVCLCVICKTDKS